MPSVAPAPANRRPIPDLGQMPDDAILDRNQVSAVSGFTVQALKLWAKQGRGPRITVVEGRPRYRVRDTREWIGAV